MVWYVVVVAAVVAVTQGQHIVSYDGTTFVNDNAQPVVFNPAPAQVPAPAFQPFVVSAPASQPALPPRQPTMFMVTPPAAPRVGIPQGFQPSLPDSCPNTHSLVHASYQRSYYHFSWCHHQAGHVFTHQQAADYCRTLNHFAHPLHFEVLRIEDTSELSFISNLLRYYALTAVWTRDTSRTAPYSIRPFINRSGSYQPGHDCLSVETALLDLHTIWFHEKSCSDAKLVICEARY